MNNEERFAFGKMNYIIMVAGLVLLSVGYIVMSLDQEEFGFGFLGITLGPIILLVGFIVEIFAIFYKPKK